MIVTSPQWQNDHSSSPTASMVHPSTSRYHALERCRSWTARTGFDERRRIEPTDPRTPWAPAGYLLRSHPDFAGDVSHASSADLLADRLSKSGLSQEAVVATSENSERIPRVSRRGALRAFGL